MILDKDNILGLIGIVMPASFSINGFFENTNKLFSCIGIIISCLVGITIVILNIKKIKAQNRQAKIDEILFKKNEL